MCFAPQKEAFCLKCPPWKLVSDGGLEYCHLSSTIWNQCSWGGKCISLASKQPTYDVPPEDSRGKGERPRQLHLQSITPWSSAGCKPSIHLQRRLDSSSFFVLNPRLTDFFWCSESAFVSSTIWNRLQWRTDLIVPGGVLLNWAALFILPPGLTAVDSFHVVLTFLSNLNLSLIPRLMFAAEEGVFRSLYSFKHQQHRTKPEHIHSFSL